MNRENPLLIAGHGRLPRISLLGLLARWIGISVWGWARSESLPVPPLSDGAASPPGGAATAAFTDSAAAEGAITANARMTRAATRPALRPRRLLPWGLIALAAVIVVAGWITRRQLTTAREILMTNPEHLSLLESARRLEEIADHSLLLRLHPGSARTLRRGAEQIREGRERLLAAARVHRACAAALDTLGLAGRLQLGAAVVAPLRRELQRIVLPVLRGALAFREMEEQSAPYGALERADHVTLRGTLAAAPPGRGLLIAPVSASGREGPVVALRQVGASFELTVDSGGAVRLTEVVRRGSAVEVIEDWQLRATSWNERGFGFPRSGSFFRIRLDAKSEAAAPRLEPLSDAARDELAPLPPDLR